MAKPSSSFQGKTALITGGSSGIGLALAQLLAREGASVWILARHKDGLQSAIQSLASVNGNKPGMLAADVSDWSQVQAAMERFQKELGVPDLLFNCAGVTEEGYAQDIPLEQYRQMMDINYFGTVHMVKAVLPGMLQRGSGHIVNISSVVGYVGAPGYAAYGPSKAAIRGLSDVLRVEAKPRGVKVSVVFPPDTDTPQLAYEKSHKPAEMLQFQEDGGLGPFRYGVHSAEKVARVILSGVRRGHYVILPGRVNSVLYYLVGLVGDLQYPILDSDWKTARHKHGKA